MAISVKRKIVLAAIFFYIAFAWAHSAHAAIIKPANNLGLTGYFNLDEGKGTTAFNHGSATSAANGTLNLAPTWTTGKLGQALTFGAANNYVSTSLAWPSSGSISEWVYPTTYADWISPAGWKTDPNVSGNGFALIDEGGSGTPGRWRAVFRPNTAGAAEVDVVALQDITQNTWQHLTMTWALSGTTYTIHLYVNGVDQGSVTWTGSLSSGVGGFNFGKSGDYADNFFKGNVDDVRVYNRVLSSAEVSVFYNRTAGTRYNSSAQSGGNGSGLNSGLVARWTMDGADVTDKVYDRTGGNNGYFYGTATSSAKVAGKLGQALRFNGSTSYVDGGTSASLAPASFTISAWAYPTTYNNAFARVLQEGTGDGSGNGGYDIEFDTGDGGCGDKTFYGVVFNGQTATRICPSGTVALNAWHHIVFIYNGTVGTLYIDGAQAGSASAVMTIATPTSFNIGRDTSGGSVFPGSIDDVRVYNRTLSASEIAQIYGQGGGKINAPAATLQHGTTLATGLVGYWPFDGSTIGTTIRDLSGIGNNGYVMGAATSSMLTAGKLGQAMKFATSTAQEILLGTAPSALTFAYNQPFSISFWAKPASGVDASTFSRMVSIVANPNKFEYFVIASNNQFIFSVGKNGVGDSSVNSPAFTPGRWYHLTAVYDGANLNFYINGASVGTAAYTFGPLSSPDGLFSVGGGGSTVSGFNGSLDEVRVYNRALSAAEVAQLYTLGR